MTHCLSRFVFRCVCTAGSSDAGNSAPHERSHTPLHPVFADSARFFLNLVLRATLAFPLTGTFACCLQPYDVCVRRHPAFEAVARRPALPCVTERAACQVGLASTPCYRVQNDPPAISVSLGLPRCPKPSRFPRGDERLSMKPEDASGQLKTALQRKIRRDVLQSSDGFGRSPSGCEVPFIGNKGCPQSRLPHDVSGDAVRFLAGALCNSF